jgi:hypothetical protein
MQCVYMQRPCPLLPAASHALSCLSYLSYPTPSSHLQVLLWSDHGWHLGDTNSWCKMTNFETGTRNTLLWRVPGQVASSKGLNHRLVESIDTFPTIVELAGLPALPQCEGVDQPPSVTCVQGVSYAAEFTGGAVGSGVGAEAVAAAAAAGGGGGAKAYAFSQWATPTKKGALNRTVDRMGYTVRSAGPGAVGERSVHTSRVRFTHL